MLVLTRKKDESIMIDDGIKITVVDIAGNQVKLGIEAPEEIDIHREEVYRQIRDENKKAVAAQKEDLDSIVKLVKNQGKTDNN